MTLINEGETAFTASADGAVLRLTADADNTAFSFQGAAVGDPAGLVSNGVDPDVEAAPGVSQVNVIEFETPTGTSSVNGDVVVVIDGAVFEAAGVTLTNTTAQPALSAPTVDASATTTVTSPTLSSNATRTDLDFAAVPLVVGDTYVVSIDYADPNNGGADATFELPVLITDTTTTATLAADVRTQLDAAYADGNGGFPYDVSGTGTVVRLATTDVVAADVSIERYTASRAVTTVTFPNNLTSGTVVSIELGGRTYSAQVGADDFGAQVTNSWSAVLAELKSQIDADYGTGNGRDWSFEVTVNGTSRTLTIEASTVSEDFLEEFDTDGSFLAAEVSGVMPILVAGDAKVQTPGAAATLSSVLASLKTAIEAGTDLTATVNGTDGTLTLTGAKNVGFDVQAAFLSDLGGVLTAGTVQEAGFEQTQQNRIDFLANAFTEGTSFTIGIDGTNVTVEVGEMVGGSAVTASASSVLGALKTKLEASLTDFTYTIDASLRRLQIEAKTANVPFEITAANVFGTETVTLADANAFIGDPTDPTTDPGTDQKQISRVTYGGTAPELGHRVSRLHRLDDLPRTTRCGRQLGDVARRACERHQCRLG